MHAKCAGASARYKAELADKAAREAAGIPSITAGVNLPNGRVFAWTTAGNYEVAPAVYEAWREYGVWDQGCAVVQTEARPTEVYGQAVAS